MSMHTCLQTCIQELPQIHKCKYRNIYTYTHTLTPIYRNINVQTPTQTHNYIQIHTNTSAQAYKHTYAYICAHIHKHSLTQIHTPICYEYANNTYTWFDKGQYDSSNEHIVCTNKSATLT